MINKATFVLQEQEREEVLLLSEIFVLDAINLKKKNSLKMPEENGNNKQIRNEIQRFKLVVVGDGACGKTSILTKFTVRRDLLIFIFTELIRWANPIIPK